MFDYLFYQRTNMSHPKTWYIVKQEGGHCEIVMDDGVAMGGKAGETQSIIQRWGPFDSANEAIARRIGLIRTGKCQPIQSTP